MTFEKIELAGGRAVLYRGDSLELLKAGMLKCDALVSDPPYGIGFQRGDGGKKLSPGTVTYTGTIISDDQPFDPSPWTDYLTDKKTMVLFGADHYKTRLPEGGRFICWDKSVGQGGRRARQSNLNYRVNRNRSWTPSSVHFTACLARSGEYKWAHGRSLQR